MSILIPSFNEGDRLRNTVEVINRGLESSFLRDFEKISVVNIVIIDDSSRESECGVLQDLSLNKKCALHFLRHSINLGQGAALQTGIDYARGFLKSDYFATMDADGQHSINDLPLLMKPVYSGSYDVSFGNRFEGVIAGIPWSRYLLLRVAVVFEYLLTGMNLRDAHNGYRVFNKKVASVINIRQNRMAHATEIKILIKKSGLKYTEVPVKITYSKESLAKGQRSSGSVHILKDLLRSFLFRG